MLYIEDVDFVLKKYTAEKLGEMDNREDGDEVWVMCCNPLGYLGVNQSKQVGSECADKCGTEAKKVKKDQSMKFSDKENPHSKQALQ
ncbi:hypothetical protein FQA39_LY00452 [Lamprigera yunnana]|nr:hypothetical protein FQA39_LY00452 [Lamprigera yunnana]